MRGGMRDKLKLELQLGRENGILNAETFNAQHSTLNIQRSTFNIEQ